jgi:GDP-4-dehydro-6-deoxy-D-mannose reductase
MYAINVQGTLNLLDEMLALGIKCPVLLVGSGAQYGPPQPDEVPICETNVCRPVTHYAVTKAMQDLLGYSYWRQGLPIVRTRAFNVIGPRQSADFVGSAIAKQIAEIECGLRPAVIELGNLDTERDFVDVRDVAQAYYLALEQGRPGEAYNIGSGKAVSIHAVLEALLGLSTVKQIEVRQSQARVRKGDVPTQIADYTKLRQQTGWRPTITLEQSLADLLQYWREISC